MAYLHITKISYCRYDVLVLKSDAVPGLVGPAHAWSQIAMQKEAKIYKKRPNYNFSNAAK